MSEERFLYFYSFIDRRVFVTERKISTECPDGYVLEGRFPGTNDIAEWGVVNKIPIVYRGNLMVILSKKSMNTAVEKMIDFHKARIDRLKEEIKEAEEDVYALEKYIDGRKESK